MAHLFENYVVEEEKIDIEGIPCIRLIPKDKKGKFRTVIFYHGLDSNKERQRMRAYMLAFSGYQVFIPDALHHGERDAKETDIPELIARYFWEAILNSIEESTKLIDNIIENYNADEDHIYVTGHSMGGFISAGVFTHNDKVRGAAPLNGSFNWEGSNDILLGAVEDFDEDKVAELESKINKLDPMKHMDKMKDRDLLILHGEKDPEVNIEPQREFFNEYKENYKNEDSAEMLEYEDLGHFVTTGMIEDIIKWIRERD